MEIEMKMKDAQPNRKSFQSFLFSLVCMSFFSLVSLIVLCVCDAVSTAVSFSTRQKFSLYPHDLFLLIVRKDEKETETEIEKRTKPVSVCVCMFVW